jgi:hypothetical protein
MNARRFFDVAVAIGLFLGALWIVDDTFQYWNAKPAMATVTAVENKTAYRGNNLTVYAGTYISATWNDNGVDRAGYVRYASHLLHGRGLGTPYVGMHVPIVYVESKPHLARLASNHTKLWIMIAPSLLLSWLLWRGKLQLGRGGA